MYLLSKMQRTFVLCYETKYVLTYFAISQRISPECREIQKSLDTRFEILKKKNKILHSKLVESKKKTATPFEVLVILV